MILIQQGKVPIPSSKTEAPRVALCPTMDLIAFSAGGGLPHVAVYRSIDWEKLFSTSCAGSSGAIAWRPDGKELAVGTNTGAVILLKTETGTPREGIAEESIASVVHDCAITSLHWTADRVRSRSLLVEEKFDDDDDFEEQSEASSSEDDEEDARIFLRPVSKRRTTAGVPEGTSTVEHDVDGEEDDDIAGSRTMACDSSLLGGKTLDVLVAGDGRGVVSLSAFGHFAVGVLDLAECFPPLQPDGGNLKATCSVSHVYLTADLQVLVAVLRRSLPDRKTDEYRLATASTQRLSDTKRHVEMIARVFTIISQYVSRIKHAIHEGSKAWQESVLAPLKKLFVPLLEDEEEALQQLQQQSDDNNDRRQVLDHLLFELLTRGVYKSSLVKFFTRTTEANLSRLIRSVDSGCDSVHRLLNSHVLKYVEALIFRLGDLVGKARADTVFEHIGVDSQFLMPFLKMAEKLLISVRRVASFTREAQTDLQTTERWLKGCRRRWPGAPPPPQAPGSQQPDAALAPVPFPIEDVKRIERMIHESDFEHTRVSLELGIQSKYRLVQQQAQVASWDRNFAGDEEEESLDMKRTRAQGLFGQITLLEQHWTEAAPRVRDALTNSFEALESRSLFTLQTEFPGEHDSRLALGGNHKGSGACLCFVDPDTAQRVSLLRLQDDGWVPMCPDYVGGNVAISHVGFCTSTPGRKSTLESSLMTVVTTSNRLAVLGWDADKMILLKERDLSFDKQEQVNLVASSGPRGVACVVSESRKLELYDIAHDEEGDAYDDPEEQDDIL